MPVIPNGNTAQVTAVFTGTSVPLGAVCTLGIESNLVPIQQATADAVWDRWEVMHTALSAAGCFLDHVEVKAGPNDTGGTWLAGTGAAGGAGNNPVPPNVTMLIKKITALGGRRGRGRMFYPCIEESEVNHAGQLDVAAIVAKQAVIDAFFDGLVADGIQPVLLHNTAAVSPTDINSLVLDQRVATQRDRLRR